MVQTFWGYFFFNAPQMENPILSVFNQVLNHALQPISCFFPHSHFFLFFTVTMAGFTTDIAWPAVPRAQLGAGGVAL